MVDVAALGLDFGKGDGLIIAIVQDSESKEVLMCAFMNRGALQKTLDTGKACFWSRSRKKLWMKGETSGNIQAVKEILVDCDKDAVVVKVKQVKGACHEGYKSCFFRRLEGSNFKVVGKKVFDPKEVYK
ncbi:MAG: phosphoribosyl-AMP cyclohydrolase [Candidatus Diapherotrites archaeon]|nr:phosphoribosyl-AMP cyclohydrolase [Candidatus Diapherotrites archaeon]